LKRPEMRQLRQRIALRCNTAPLTLAESRGYIAERPAKLRRISRRFREHLGQVSPESPTCNAPWVSAVVEVDGSVRPCFFHRPVGNIGSSTLEEVVNGEAARVFRQSLRVSENPTCRRCVCSLNYQGG